MSFPSYLSKIIFYICGQTIRYLIKVAMEKGATKSNSYIVLSIIESLIFQKIWFIKRMLIDSGPYTDSAYFKYLY